jgi:hypothetical protein
MTDQYFHDSINGGPDPCFAISTALNAGDQQGSNASNDTVFFFDPVTISSADHFTVTSTAALGTTFTILQPGTYVAQMTGTIDGAASSLAISLGGAANSFGSTPAAISATTIALSSSLAADTSIVEVATSFHIAPANLAPGGVANVLRFLGTENGVWVASSISMRLFRVTAS